MLTGQIQKIVVVLLDMFSCFPDTGSLISWKSRKQSTAALSSCEAEYMSTCAAVQEAKFLMQLLNDMTPVFHQRSKHIDIKYHFIRSEVEKGFIQPKYIPSED